jgi:hypothetical protein
MRYQGYFGLLYKPGNDGYTSLLEQLINTGAVSSKIVSFYYGEKKGKITIGAPDSDSPSEP